MQMIMIMILTVDAKISCGQHANRKLLQTFESVNLTLYRLLSPVIKYEIIVLKNQSMKLFHYRLEQCP